MTRIKVKSKKDDGHRIIPASGVWGGVTAHGMIYFDVVLEKPEAPDITVINVDDSTGERVETLEGPAEQMVERLLMAGIIVRPEIARAIGHWLVEKADEAEGFGRVETNPEIVQ